jgi:hypothetical protein
MRNALLVLLAAATLGGCSKPPNGPAQASAPANAVESEASTRIFTNEEGLAIGGFDPVSYFHGAPAAGDAAFESVVDRARFRFATAENKAAFDANPGAYLPQYGGYCAYGASQGGKFPTVPETGTVVAGKLYFNKNREVQALWNKDQAGLIRKADEKWPSIENDKPRG